ncbi:DUF1911 domain-containing protein [Paraburkholderia bannensis]|uniref:PoNi C-terminal domain-containing protein n=1 Tax=Paraburkholderia tropica TaxID=92647 RepID=A0AAQ1GQ19_9BURK|nr:MULTISPECIES: PoNe immunity protein domain-containing protein [Paraburkholderia]RQM51002.1 DUF1911 domain-containing protein [Paraburkholderia bannensis]RQN33695.1 DUF1911 domain-containing protein [Paraburkholderia tropica]SEK15759.1 protein of unknown function [Paraburkholderia tropica]
MSDFEFIRRQRFLGEAYYKWLLPLIDEEIAHWSSHMPPNGGSEEGKAALGSRYVARETFRRFFLRYTGGADLNLLRSEFEEVVSSLERYTAAKRVAEKDSTYPPFMFGEIEEYEAAIQLISLCHLLHRRDLLPRLAAMLDPSYRAQDTLYEDLFAYGMDGRVDVDKWYHEQYRDVINSLYSDTDELGISLITSCLDGWYRAMRSASWYDSHLKANPDEGGAYVGYWAIEAAAVSFLLELDDNSYRDHLLYPKDLVDFARKFDSKQDDRPPAEFSGPPKVRTGQPCPETGVWKAVGHNVPGVLVQQGEPMPEVFAPDRSGAHRPQPALWEWERKA